MPGCVPIVALSAKAVMRKYIVLIGELNIMNMSVPIRQEVERAGNLSISVKVSVGQGYSGF